MSLKSDYDKKWSNSERTFKAPNPWENMGVDHHHQAQIMDIMREAEERRYEHERYAALKKQREEEEHISTSYKDLKKVAEELGDDFAATCPQLHALYSEMSHVIKIRKTAKLLGGNND